MYFKKQRPGDRGAIFKRGFLYLLITMLDNLKY